MTQARVLVTATALLLTGGLTACGGDSSSTSSTASASKADFCRTFNQLGADASPQDAAAELSRVGVPSDITASARHGFQVLVDHLQELSPNTKPGMVTQMVKNLPAQDASDVRSFITYYATECQGLPGDSSS